MTALPSVELQDQLTFSFMAQNGKRSQWEKKERSRPAGPDDAAAAQSHQLVQALELSSSVSVAPSWAPLQSSDAVAMAAKP
jgi:hypothetical protein